LLLLFMFVPWQSVGSRLDAKPSPSRRHQRKDHYYST
jgi:hypothetical protein